MKPEDLDIDWIYLIERLESLVDLGEELLSRRIAEVELEPQALLQNLAFVWIRDGAGGFLREVTAPDIQPLSDLIGIEKNVETLRRNTLQFILGYPANNVLLWGEKGSGKSSCVKGLLHEFSLLGLRLIEVRKEDLDQLPLILKPLRALPYRFILFCGDLSFPENDRSARELKRILAGGIEGQPENLIIYATSNSHHLLPEHLHENYGGVEIHPEEALAERLSLADRFGLRLPFYAINEEIYLKIISQMLRHLGIRKRRQTFEDEARLWAMGHGGESGRVARQFVTDLAGRLLLIQHAKQVRTTKKI
jgi:predicted AAA+ superfamily ATPase